VAHACEALERGVDDRPRGAPANVGDEADAAGVAFVERAVQTRPLSREVEELDGSRLLRLT
jgi:hypothetical protein